MAFASSRRLYASTTHAGRSNSSAIAHESPSVQAFGGSKRLGRDELLCDALVNEPLCRLVLRTVVTPASVDQLVREDRVGVRALLPSGKR